MWQENNNRLCRKFVFRDFPTAFSFMTHVALLAERLDHHPAWKNVWNTVEFWLCTHSAGDVVTGKDRHMAAEIDKLAAPYPGGSAT